MSLIAILAAAAITSPPAGRLTEAEFRQTLKASPNESLLVTLRENGNYCGLSEASIQAVGRIKGDLLTGTTIILDASLYPRLGGSSYRLDDKEKLILQEELIRHETEAETAKLRCLRRY